MYCRETDKLLFGGIDQIIVLGVHSNFFFKQGVSKSKQIIEYPIKIADVA